MSLCHALPGASAEAADLTGVWVTDKAVCNKVFVKKGNKVSFAKNSDVYGGGFIIDGKEIRGPMAKCRIKATKEDGDTTHMIAACATDIMLSDVQLSVKVIDADSISRLFPGMQDMSASYYRCTM
jgi:hypothetical protein